MKSSWGRFFIFQRNDNFMPFSLLEIEKPEIIEICKVLSPKNHKIVRYDFWNMICSLPRSNLEINGFDSFPFFSIPVKRINWVESFFALSTACKKNETIMVFIIIESGIWSWFRNVTSCLIILPLKRQCTKNPEIVHIVGIYVINNFTCISSKDY